ncbi:hypothetical protein JVV96_20545, partial [Vibrio cholerae O1]|nr:hypothetical protein [Vibrio cholerae O1]
MLSETEVLNESLSEVLALSDVDVLVLVESLTEVLVLSETDVLNESLSEALALSEVEALALSDI